MVHTKHLEKVFSTASMAQAMPRIFHAMAPYLAGIALGVFLARFWLD